VERHAKIVLLFSAAEQIIFVLNANLNISRTCIFSLDVTF